ncbi:tetratricopeptide repeat protein [Thermotoga sp. KOL6]|uniref:tetratricopeptide repeat protein n=1 Tax=Thermotoga sp. KOL6 TaxID=126741 RepID=UPI000C7870D9|nr:tetratricopeptide repeat protein [Thermotoga sp. KOL6]PLV60394.1 hypothetical protein AS005_03725 [Thermotoga sp. KOL6]
MRKAHFFIIVAIATTLTIFLVGCMSPIAGNIGGNVPGGGTTPTTDDVLSNLNQGNIDEAKEQLEQVLQDNPDDPVARALKGILETRDALVQLSELTSNSKMFSPYSIDSLKKLPVSLMKTPSLMGFSLFMKNIVPMTRQPSTVDVQGFYDYYNQELIPALEELHELLESAEEDLSVAVDANIEFHLQVNTLDWDNDGTAEPNQPLIITDGIISVEAYKIIFGLEEPVFSSTPTIDPNGGDAWFDIETLDALVQGGQIPDPPEFNDNDYIQIDNGELGLLLTIVTSLKALIDPILTWNLNIPQDLYDEVELYLTNPSTMTLYQIFDFIDTSDDATITGSEWEDRLDPFLEFLPGGADYLVDFVDSLVSAANGLLRSIEDIENDLDASDVHDLTSGYYFVDPSMDFDEVKTQLQNFIDTEDVPDLLITTDATVTLHFGALRNTDNYQDLKDYFPDAHWDEIEGIMFDEELPDPTFGGFIEYPPM